MDERGSEPRGPSPDKSADEFRYSWMEIAEHFKCSARTVLRWEGALPEVADYAGSPLPQNPHIQSECQTENHDHRDDDNEHMTRGEKSLPGVLGSMDIVFCFLSWLRLLRPHGPGWHVAQVAFPTHRSHSRC